MNFSTRFLTLVLTLSLLCLGLMTIPATAQQVVGSFPTMDGGFEGQTAGVLGNVTIANGVQRTDWTANGSNLATIYSGTARTGSKFVTFNSASSSKRLQSPTAANGAVVNTTPYIVQYYYRTAGATAPGGTSQFGASPDGTSSPGTYVAITLTGTSGAWVKSAAAVSSGTSALSPKYGISIARWNTAMTAAEDIDDMVMYPGTVIDVTAPDPATAPITTTIVATQIGLSWSAPGTGVDGGGYMVVRKLGSDPTTTPNVNGIYAVGNTVAVGEQVVYLGTATSFTDLGLTPSTAYYYRIYTVDKAFNYSTPITINATTTTPSYATEPTIQATSVVTSNPATTSFDISWTAGDGTNHLIVVSAGSPVSGTPTDGSSYTANTAYGSGSTIATGNYVVYNGTGTSVSITGLTKVTRYYVAVFEFNGSAGTENYLITNPATGNQMTLPAEIISAGTSSAGVTWSTGSAWIGGVAPGQTDNATIVSGDKIIVSASQSCNNLTIQAGGKVYNNVALPTSSLVYLTIYGTSAVINGTLGDKTDAGVDCGLGINFAGNLTVSGSGTIRPARMRPNTGLSNVSLTIDANVQLTYTGSTGTGGAGLYTDNTGNDNISITVNAGKTLSFVNTGNLNTASSTTVNGTASTTFNINGTVDLSGAASNMSLAIATGKTCALNIGRNGSLVIGNKLFGSVVPAATPTITDSGSITINQTADFTDPSMFIGGQSGSFTLPSGATINIGATAGLDPFSGPIRTDMRNFSTGANYNYVGTAAQATGSDLPATVNNFTINNAAGVTLSSNSSVNGVLAFTAGNLITGANTITVPGSISGASATSHVEGRLALVYGSTGSKTFPIGKGGIYRPLSLNYTTLSGTSTVTAEQFETALPGAAPSYTTIYPARYWTVTQTGGSSFAYNLTLDGTGFTPTGTPVILKKDLGTIANVASTTPNYTATGLTDMSDFALGDYQMPTWTLSVTAVNGTVTKNPDQTSYDNGTVVTLTPMPEFGYHFVNWSGDVPTGHETDASLSITMDANKSISANFVLNSYPLNLSVAGSGATTKTPDLTEYPHGEMATIEATAATGWHFTSWSGDKIGITNPDTVLMTSAKNITANFSPDQFPIAVMAMNGMTVPSTVVLANYGADQRVTYMPFTGYHFDSIIVDGVKNIDSTTSYTFMNVTTAHSITAYFSINTYTLDVTVSGTGTVAKSPSLAEYSYGDTVLLTATPDTGSSFLGWTGDEVGSANPLAVVMTANKSITATFASQAFTLTTSAVNGAIAKSPDQASYMGHTLVLLSAIPNPGYTFIGWSGAVTGTTNPIEIYVDSNMSVTAEFAIERYSLTLSAMAGGTAAKNPDLEMYEYGTQVTLTATPDTGYHFVQWTGDVPMTGAEFGNPLVLTMDAPKSVTAVFAIDQFSIAYSAVNGMIWPGPLPALTQTSREKKSYIGGDTVMVNFGANRTFNYQPYTNYHFDSVMIDGMATTAYPTDYTFMDVRAVHSITAYFSTYTWTLTVNAVNGTVVKTPDQPTYDDGTGVELMATPAPGYTFTGWTGDVPQGYEMMNPLPLTMDANKNVTANFTIPTYGLMIYATNGSVAKNPDQQTYDSNSTVQLTAVPAQGYHFVDWGGDATGSTNPLTVTMDRYKSIIANFAQTTYTLTVNAAHGTVTLDPATGPYLPGTWVKVMATPNSGYEFIGWTDNLTSSNNPDSVLMDTNKTITANFAVLVYAYRSHQTGNWNDTLTWERNPGSGWIYPQPSYPGLRDSAIEVQSGHVVTVNFTPDTVDQFTIDAGGQVTVATGNTFSIANGAGTDLTLNGTLLNNATVGLLTGATATVSGTYQHNVNGGAIPAATWQTGSTCLVTGATANAPSGANQDFYNFTWNCPGQTAANVNLGYQSRNVTISGTFTAAGNGWLHTGTLTTGDHQLRLFGGNGRCTINNLVVKGWSTYLSANGSTYLDTIVINGNVTVQDGAAMCTANNSSAVANWFIKGNLTVVDSGYIGKSTSGNLSSYIFNGTGIQHLSLPNASMNYFFGAPMFVDTTGATVDLGTSLIGGSGSFRVRPGATLISGHANGINGNILTTGGNGGGNVFSTTANYGFNGLVAQVTGTFLPTAVNNLTLDNAAGVTLSGSTTVNGALTFTNGKITTGSYALTLGSSATVSGAGSSKYVDGAEAWTLPGQGGSPTKQFDIGDPTNYTPVSVSVNNISQGGVITARSIAGAHPSIGTSTINTAKMLGRYYGLSNSGTTFDTYNATFNYVSGDLIGGADPNNFIVGKWNGSSWEYPAVGTKTATSTQITGATAFSDFVIGEPISNWTLTVTAYNGSITKSPDQTSYTNGTMVTLTPVAATGYHFSQWTGDATGSANPLSVTMDANKAIGAIFSIDTLTITTEAGPNGTIYPGGPVSVTYGSGMQFYITASPGYHVDSLFVDGVPQTPGPMYMFTNITANHTIRATFALSGFSIMASAGANGSISPTGEVFVQVDSNQSFTITPNVGYHVDSLFIDGAPETPAVVYNFLTVEANHTIHVTFAIDQELIEASAGPNGTISPDGKTYLSYGGTQEYIFTPASGYHADSLFIDGEGQLAPASYTFTNVTTNHTIHVTFAINNYTVTVEAQNGTVALSPIRESYQYGDTVRLTPTPLTGYHFMHWSGQDVPQGHETDIPLVIVMDASKSITAIFAIDTFAIVATNGAHGTIAPSGTTSVTYGSSQAYTLTPDLGYHVDSLVVDDTARIAETSYEFTNVTANHAIYAAFARNTYSITTSAGANGAVAPLGEQKVYHGDTLVVAITPDAGYHVDSLIIDGVNQSAATSFTFANITASHTLRATFAIDQYTITAASGPNGTVTPAGVTSVSYNGSQAYSITPSTGYHIDSLFIDGISSTVVTGYTFTGVTANHTIRATFAINTFTITATSGANGSIDPQGAVSVNYGANQTFTFTAATGYHIDSVIVDGVAQTVAPSYTFTGVTVNHTIRVVFKINSYTITATSGPNGTIDPAGVVTLLYGQSQIFTFHPATGYHVDSVIVDGIFAGSAAADTIGNIADNHTIRVTFAIVTYPITVTVGPNGTITPSGVVEVSYNGNQTFSIHPLTGYHIASVTVDGSPVAVDTSYTFHNVLAPHTIAATFAINTYDITATLATSNGTIDPSGTITVNYGVDTTFRIVPNKGYEVDSLYIDGVGQDIADSGSVESYTFPAVAENHTIRVVFDVLPLYRIQYRTFKYDSLCVQNAMRKRNVSEECQFTITNTTSGTVTEINMYFGFNITSVLQSGPMTATGARKIWKFTGSFPAGQSFNLKVMVPSTSKQKIARMWFGPAKGTPNVLNLKPYATQLLLKMPNAANVRDTLWSLPQYILDGFTVGVTKRDSAESYGWVVMRSRYDMFRSWYFSRKKHTDINVGFLTFTKNAEPFTKEHKELPPSRQNNKTFADLVSLKFSLALSQHGIAPSGLGELRYTEPGNPFAGMLVREIAALGDTMMTLAKWDRWHSHQDLYGKLDTALIHINGAFSGSIDTVTWSTHLKLTGCARVIDQIYLEPTGLPPTVATQSYAGNVAVPRKAELHQNYPNPFNPTTTIRFQLPEDGLVTLKVYNILGQEVATLVNHEEMTAGSSEVDFNAGRYASGVYFYRLKVEPIVEEDGTTTGQYFNLTKKMILVK